MSEPGSVVFVGVGAGPEARPTSAGAEELARATRAYVEPEVARAAGARGGLSAAIVEPLSVRGDGSLAPVLVARAHAGERVCRVMADPLRRARAEIDAVVRAGVAVTLQPGVDTRPLAGRRVLVTRAVDDARETVERLEAMGAEAVVAPVIEIRALTGPADERAMKDAIAALSTYDWVAFTSANGVDRFVRALSSAGKDARAFGPARIAALGPGTAGALERHSLLPDRIASEQHGEGLAAALLRDARPGQRVLLPRARVARDVLPDALRAAGVDVHVLPIYETVAATRESFRPVADAFLAGSIDAVTLASSSAARHLVALLGDDAIRLLSAVIVASIGPITTETATSLGVRVDVSASPHTAPELLLGLERAFEKLRPAPT
jgi:uroporphyrinogen III methyltransferase/synthase